MKIFSTEEIKAIKQYTLREQGLSARDFIENIGETLAIEVITALDKGHKIVMFAGPDLNGAYGLSAARHLALQGYRPDIYFFNTGGRKAIAETVALRERLVEECGADIITEVTGVQFSMPDLQGPVTVIDAIFGTERTEPLSGGYKSIVQYINEMKPKVISIDVPSGLVVDSVETLINRNIIHATVTLAIGSPRVAFFLPENAELLGRWKLIPVDYSQAALDRAPWQYRLIERSEIKQLLHPRDPFASKADCGDTILFAGSYGMLGAAVLCGRGAIRAGAGKVTVHSPRCAFYVLQTSLPSALYENDPGDVAITSIELRHNYKSVAIGPGIGTADVTIDALDAFLKIANANSRPVVLDADALNCISIRPAMLDHIPVMSILTPHAGEFDRLFGKQPTTYARILRAIEVSRRRHIIIVLKGRYTAVIRPDGKVYFNPTGTPALATAGAGDVLTGVIAGLLAQGMRPEFAAVAGPYIHGMAGELAAQTYGIHGTDATDVADNIGRAIKSLLE